MGGITFMVKCDKCGAENVADAVRCKKCAQPFNSKKEGSSNTKLIAIIAIVVIIAIVGVFAMGIFSNNNNAQVQSSEPTQSNVSNNTTNNSSNSNQPICVSSANSDKFHKPDCEWAQKISDKNKITYPSRDKAIDAGKVPCSVCNP